jgi:chromatin remodeling complex protein RSC6
MSTSASVSKTTKKSAKTTVEAPVAVVVAAPVVAAPVKASKKEKASVATAAPAPVAAPVAVTATVTSEATVAAVEEDIAVTLANAVARQHELVTFAKSNAAEQVANLKTIEKLSSRLAKKAERKRKNRKAPVEGAAPKPCIFTTPVAVSDELLAFLGKPKNTEISRSNVTKAISTYCKEHKLMNKQTINADAPLRKLLTLKEDDKLTILNLQKYLGRHYIKPTPTAA